MVIVLSHFCLMIYVDILFVVCVSLMPVLLTLALFLLFNVFRDIVCYYWSDLRLLTRPILV